MSNQHMTQAVLRLRNGTTNEVARAQVEATLALAYEQRTANFIAAYNGDIAKRVEGAAAEQYPMHNQIVERLDLA